MADTDRLTEGYIVKGGTNDLSRWAVFGGALQRPAPPAPVCPAKFQKSDYIAPDTDCA